ncbi:MAG: hypothetical protein NC485_12245 [Ruminococcus flavefaciens]|nr:hypothetical protein [Ruminococcus flavefaciens]MCM1060089.1 hypothetical protein [Eubacterium sp.]
MNNNAIIDGKSISANCGERITTIHNNMYIERVTAHPLHTNLISKIIITDNSKIVKPEIRRMQSDQNRYKNI